VRKETWKKEEWVKLMKRETSEISQWFLTQSDSVCNEHFVDGIPTAENPNPTLKLGYTIKERIKRRQLFRSPLQKTTKISTSSCLALSATFSTTNVIISKTFLLSI